MNKIDLLKLIENKKDDEDINEIILSQEDFAKSSDMDFNSISLDQFKELLANNKTISGYYQAISDSKVTKGLETFKEKTMPGLIQEELNKLNNKDKTPEQIQLEKIMEENRKLNADLLKSKQISEITPKISEMGLPIGLINYVLADDPTKTEERLNELKSMFDEFGNGAVNRRLNETAPQPPDEGHDFKNTVSKDDFLNMSFLEQQKFASENKEEYEKIMS